MISVLNAPLFSVVNRDGRETWVGLLDLLAEAHNIVELKANSCTGKLALMRFCMAFLMDAYDLQTLSDRRALLRAKRFDRSILEKYIARCEADGACFLLDDAKHPFLQAGYDEELDAKAEKPVAKIMFDLPGGNNHIHLEHRREDEHEADPALAFEAMLETYMFCPAGLSGASNVNNMPPIYVILHGRNLFETLALNMVSQGEIGNIPYGRGETAWRRKEQIIPGTKCVEMSLLKALTWQPRRLSLCWDEDGMIRHVYLQNGLNFQGNGLWMDPHVLYRQTKTGDMVSIKPELGRELWRDAGALVHSGDKTRSSVPVMGIEDDVWQDCPAILDVEMIGLITSQESILGRVNERLRIPVAIVENETLSQEFCSALEICEQMYGALVKTVIWQFCHPGDKKKKSMVAQQAGEAYLHAMHDVLFGDYLRWLREGLSFRERYERYRDAMWEVLNVSVLGKIIEKTGNDVESIKRQNAVRGKVRKEFKAIWEGR